MTLTVKRSRRASLIGLAAVRSETGVEMRVEDGALRVSRQIYGGKAQAVIELKRTPAVVWLRAPLVCARSAAR